MQGVDIACLAFAKARFCHAESPRVAHHWWANIFSLVKVPPECDCEYRFSTLQCCSSLWNRFSFEVVTNWGLGRYCKKLPRELLQCSSGGGNECLEWWLEGQSAGWYCTGYCQDPWAVGTVLLLVPCECRILRLSFFSVTQPLPYSCSHSVCSLF